MSTPKKSIPVEADWPFYFSTSIVIHKPRQKIWDVLLDFPSYNEWNPYIRESILIDASKKPVPSYEIAKGHRVALKVHMPAAMDDSVKTRSMTELVMHVKPLTQLAWGSHLPGWLFGAEHWNVLSEFDGGTKFEIIAVFRGAGPHLMMMSMKEVFADSLKAMAEALKARCEQD
ncbi:hypothetical protein B0H10DRAFT_1796376 [Mycena sp. CBHHK59/15]|nr:hypothetical protein B0H10DRAFT_1796376 [Mycena sp. CBHHK59/15]